MAAVKGKVDLYPRDFHGRTDRCARGCSTVGQLTLPSAGGNAILDDSGNTKTTVPRMKTLHLSANCRITTNYAVVVSTRLMNNSYCIQLIPFKRFYRVTQIAKDLSRRFRIIGCKGVSEKKG